MHDLWQQHTEEMKILEGHVLTVCEKGWTVEFQPCAADTLRQSWLQTNSTVQLIFLPWCQYPWRKHKHHGWKHWFSWIWFLEALYSGKKKLWCIQQPGPPRIRQFADRLRPEPLHCEINAWQRFIDLQKSWGKINLTLLFLVCEHP